MNLEPISLWNLILKYILIKIIKALESLKVKHLIVFLVFVIQSAIPYRDFLFEVEVDNLDKFDCFSLGK